jgi:hypothetical protein
MQAGESASGTEALDSKKAKASPLVVFNRQGVAAAGNPGIRGSPFLPAIVIVHIDPVSL